MKEYRIRDKAGNTAVILPEKGATVLSLYVNGKEAFYQNMENINSPERPRCGIPFLFPAYGRTEDNSKYPLGIHGFGHTSSWKVLSRREEELCLELTPNEEMKQVYPFEFRVVLTFHMENGKLRILQSYENHGEADMPFTFGFHPYFAVDPTEVQVKIAAEAEIDRFTGAQKPFDGSVITPQFSEGASETGSFYMGAKEEAVLLWKEKEIHMQFDENFNRLVFWAVQGKEFLCVEPINTSPNGLATGDCYTLAPGEKREAQVSFWIK